MDAAVFEHLWQRRHALVFCLAVSHRYHRKRQRFFDLLDKGTKAATVLLGASLPGEWLRLQVPVIGAIIAGLGLFALVFGYGDRKQAHKELAEACMQLQAQVDLAGPATFTEAQLNGWEADVARLNGREPPNLRTLVTICQNEQAIALGQPQSVHPVPWHRRLLADWM